MNSQKLIELLSSEGEFLNDSKMNILVPDVSDITRVTSFGKCVDCKVPLKYLKLLKQNLSKDEVRLILTNKINLLIRKFYIAKKAKKNLIILPAPPLKLLSSCSFTHSEMHKIAEKNTNAVCVKTSSINILTEFYSSYCRILKDLSVFSNIKLKINPVPLLYYKPNWNSLSEKSDIFLWKDMIRSFLMMAKTGFPEISWGENETFNHEMTSKSFLEKSLIKKPLEDPRSNTNTGLNRDEKVGLHSLTSMLNRFTKKEQIKKTTPIKETTRSPVKYSNDKIKNKKVKVDEGTFKEVEEEEESESDIENMPEREKKIGRHSLTSLLSKFRNKDENSSKTSTYNEVKRKPNEDSSLGIFHVKIKNVPSEISYQDVFILFSSFPGFLKLKKSPTGKCKLFIERL